MFEERREDRRRRYSFRGHLQRLRQSGRLSKIITSTAISVLVIGISVSRCTSSKITGPTEAEKPAGPAGGQATTSASGPKTATAIFPADLLPAINPCDPSLGFDTMEGGNNVTYTDEPLVDAMGLPTGDHRITYSMAESQSGKDKKGNSYKGSKNSGETVTIKRAGQSFTTISKFRLKVEDSPMQTCTVVANGNGVQGGGNSCDFDSAPSYLFLVSADPLTNQASLTVTTVSIGSSCASSVIAMRE